MIHFSVSGLDSVSSDFETEKKFIEKQIPVALDMVGAEMKANLQTHIMDDWYHRYSPKQYKRRTDLAALGTALGDEKNMTVERRGQFLYFDYSPTGEHQNDAWHDRDGDELIAWIQQGSGEIPPRPFWNNFLEEQKNGGIIGSFIGGMGEIPVIEEGGDSDVLFDGAEGELENSSGNEMPY